MKILCFGSLNIDMVYSVPRIVAPGETIASANLSVFCGGKGLNQSIALSRAGVPVCHAGMIGGDGEMLLDICRENRIGIKHIRVTQARTGTAVIQVDREGQNSIILYGGANRQITETFVDEVLREYSPGDFILLQNEISLLDYITEKAAEKGLYIIMNPSPFDEAVTPAVLERVSLFILNEIEGGQITGLTGPEGILAEMQRRFPDAGCALTLGKSGVLYGRGGELHRHGAYDVEAVDTTAAGDTFTGYFAGCLSRGYPPGEALRIASAASALAVSKMGAGSSVPMWDEVVSADLRLLPEK